MTDAPMRYLEFEPNPELRPWIASIWSFTVAANVDPIAHHVPLTGGAILSIGRSGELILTGERTSPLITRVTGGDRFWGVHFWPAAVGAFLGVPPAELREWAGPARLRLNAQWCDKWREVLTVEGSTTSLQRIEELLRAIVPRSLDPSVMTAVFRIIRSAGAEPVTQIASAVGLSPRQLRRRFACEAALTPKELARVRRVRSVAATAATGEQRWIELASAGGYADQSHLVREFKEVLGLTPAGFRAHAERIAHRLVE